MKSLKLKQVAVRLHAFMVDCFHDLPFNLAINLTFCFFTPDPTEVLLNLPRRVFIALYKHQNYLLISGNVFDLP